ncbi:hypothetical protein BXZ70DRAFT_961456 [Cristinia sonorae]|uniref:AB hydrolase-1 domain-containing protein n=1 Tax=Cristinia sonorae TaxID=1940300 RepID=A0A8K0XK36_9AGAR|nr:hypothetical protein BXZ70DRAFT_961456 [Cristinia sonorae]
MPDLNVVKYGLLAVHDTGTPNGGGEYYPTLIMLHGYAWHSGIFSRMIPFAAKHGVRLVLVNRRGYPHTSPFNEEEISLLNAGTLATAEGADSLRKYLVGRGKDLYDFIEEFIATEKISQKGGIILAAWSFGVVFTTSLLANAPSFPQGDINVASYTRCVLNYDPPYHALGYPYLEGGYNPLVDQTITPEEGARRFPRWVSGYYRHGESPAELEPRTPLSEPQPTIETMALEDIQSALYPGPGNPGGSDATLMNAGIQHGLFKESRLKAYFPSETSPSAWDEVKLRHVWCDQTVWEAPYTKYCLEAEFEDAKKAGRKTRPLEITRMRQANHFIHWDQPERSLLVLLGDGNAAQAVYK